MSEQVTPKKERELPFGMKIVDGKIVGKLQRGIKVEGKAERQKDFVMRQTVTQDMFDAEAVATADLAITFAGAIISLVLENIGEMKGPIPLSLIGALSPKDYKILYAAQKESEELGED